MMTRFTHWTFTSLLTLGLATAHAQAIIPVTPPAGAKLIPLPNQTQFTPELAKLIELEARFSDDVAKSGGKAFANWFAEDGITLNNGQPAVMGRRDIAAHANWDPKEYQLTWQTEGAQMSPAGDMGFAWGHYDATTTHPSAKQPAHASGRFITIWKKVGSDWKVALDASANDAGEPDMGGTHTQK